MKRLLGTTLLGLGAVLSLPTTAASRISHIPLDYRTAQELLPLLQPHLDEDTRLSGRGGSLVLQGEADTIARLEALIEELDRAPQSLRISLRRAHTLRGEQRGFGASGRIDSRQGAQGRIRIYREDQARDSQATHSVRGLDGRPVRIAQALSLPVTERSVLIRRHGSAAVDERVHYLQLEDGFHALPRLRGERVSVDILVRQQVPRDGGGAEGMELVTRVEGRLGEWLPLGSWSESESRQGAGRRLSTRQAAQAQQRWWLRVERLAE